MFNVLLDTITIFKEILTEIDKNVHSVTSNFLIKYKKLFCIHLHKHFLKFTGQGLSEQSVDDERFKEMCCIIKFLDAPSYDDVIE